MNISRKFELKVAVAYKHHPYCSMHAYIFFELTSFIRFYRCNVATQQYLMRILDTTKHHDAINWVRLDDNYPHTNTLNNDSTLMYHLMKNTDTQFLYP